MNIAKITAQGDGVFTVAGDMNFTTINSLLAQSDTIFATTVPITLDLSAVQHANSAGLALLLEWQHQAQNKKQSLRICNPPKALIDIARISNCEKYL
jgi:phospholipid transport system transporter-binding protein